MTAPEPSNLVVAAGTMAGVRCYLDADPERLTRLLSRLGPIELTAPTERQICCELWTLTEGRLLIGGLEREAWIDVARETGRLMGGIWGASWAGMLSNVVREASERAGAFMAAQAHDVTRWTAIEPYHELLLTVPDVLFDGRSEPVSVVLGMATDLPLAVKVDHLAYYGYDKRLATVTTDDENGWEVSIDGAPFLQARFEATGRGECDLDRAAASSVGLQPLLGGLRDRRPMLAELRRDLATSREEIHEVEGVVEIGQELFPGVTTGSHEVRSRTAPANRISVRFRDVPATVTYPRPAT